MANYDLAFTGSQIDSAIGKVQNAETTVADSTNMIQSAAVFTGINNLSTTNFTAGTLVTSGETFPDNDTTIPTCAAVKDEIGSGLGTAKYVLTAEGTTNGSVVLGVTEDSDSKNIATVSSGVVTLGAGTYIVGYTGEFKETFSGSFSVQLRHNDVVKTTDTVNQSDFLVFNNTLVITSASSQTVDLYAQESGNGSLTFKNIELVIAKLA